LKAKQTGAAEQVALYLGPSSSGLPPLKCCRCHISAEVGPEPGPQLLQVGRWSTVNSRLCGSKRFSGQRSWKTAPQQSCRRRPIKCCLFELQQRHLFNLPFAAAGLVDINALGERLP